MWNFNDLPKIDTSFNMVEESYKEQLKQKQKEILSKKKDSSNKLTSEKTKIETGKLYKEISNEKSELEKLYSDKIGKNFEQYRWIIHKYCSIYKVPEVLVIKLLKKENPDANPFKFPFKNPKDKDWKIIYDENWITKKEKISTAIWLWQQLIWDNLFPLFEEFSYNETMIKKIKNSIDLYFKAYNYNKNTLKIPSYLEKSNINRLDLTKEQSNFIARNNEIKSIVNSKKNEIDYSNWFDIIENQIFNAWLWVKYLWQKNETKINFDIFNPEDQIHCAIAKLRVIKNIKDCNWETALAFYHSWSDIKDLDRNKIISLYKDNPQMKLKLPSCEDSWNYKNYLICAIAAYTDSTFYEARKLLKV